MWLDSVSKDSLNMTTSWQDMNCTWIALNAFPTKYTTKQTLQTLEAFLKLKNITSEEESTLKSWEPLTQIMDFYTIHLISTRETSEIVTCNISSYI